MASHRFEIPNAALTYSVESAWNLALNCDIYEVTVELMGVELYSQTFEDYDCDTPTGRAQALSKDDAVEKVGNILVDAFKSALFPRGEGV